MQIYAPLAGTKAQMPRFFALAIRAASRYLYFPRACL
jgi:hypothetical protein